jgi:hypothetical protein
MMKIVIFVNPKTHIFVSGVCLQHLHNIQDSVSEIVVITSGNHVKEFHHHLGFTNITYIEEHTVCHALGMSSNKLCSYSKQFVILNLDRIIDGNTFLNVDADVIFNQPVKFMFGDQRKFYLEQENFAPYFATLEEMCGIKKQIEVDSSFIADFMVLDRQYLEQMRTQSPILKNWSAWNTVAKKHNAVSEYETYGNWMYAAHSNKMLLEKNNTYYDNMKYYKFNPTQENLDANPYIIPMRNTYDFDIDWAPIFPNWKF